MSETIKDGCGSGYLTRVTSDNRLTTYAVIAPYIEFASSKHQDAYNLNLIRAPVSASTQTIVMQIRNTDPQRLLHIWNNVISYNGGDTNHNRVLDFNISTGVSFPPTSGYVLGFVAPLWINLPKTPPITGYLWDKTTPGGMQFVSPGSIAFSTLITQGSYYHPLDGCVVIPPGDTLTYSMNAEETGVASLSVKMYFKAAEDD